MHIVLPQDCRSLVWNQFPDVTIADLPYRRHVHENATSCGTEALGGSGPGVHNRDLGFAHLDPKLRWYIARLVAQTKRWSLLYSDFENSWLVRLACEAAGAEYVRAVPWVRWSQPQLSGDRPTQGFEMTQLFHRQYIGKRGGKKPLAKTWNGRGNLTHWDHKALRRDDKHPTEKPLDQALDMVCYLSEPGELIHDPTCGRGTTGVACVLLGRRFVGCELDATEAVLGQDRIAKALRGELSARDSERVSRWLDTLQEAAYVKVPTKPEEIRAWERAQRRLRDGAYLVNALRLAA